MWICRCITTAAFLRRTLRRRCRENHHFLTFMILAVHGHPGHYDPLRWHPRKTNACFWGIMKILWFLMFCTCQFFKGVVFLHLSVASFHKPPNGWFDLASFHLRVASLQTHPYWLFCAEAILVLPPFRSSPCYVKFVWCHLSVASLEKLPRAKHQKPQNPHNSSWTRVFFFFFGCHLSGS